MAGASFPPGLIANVAGTRAFVEPLPEGLAAAPEPPFAAVAAVVVAGDGVGFVELWPAVRKAA